MRPALADRKSINRSFRIGFDPVNTLAMNLVAEGLEHGDLRRLSQLPREQQQMLERIYGTLAAAQPSDPAAPRLRSLLLERPLAATTVTVPGSVIDATQAVLAAIVAAAHKNAGHLADSGAPGEPARLTGDELTSYYVRSAAVAAERENDAVRKRALLLALAVALDTSDLLREHPLSAPLWKRLESDTQRTARLTVLGQPTLLGRQVLTQHFFVSAALSSLGGVSLAESAGLAKELRDSESDSGFSFTDLAADLAGIAWAQHISAQEITAPKLLRFDARSQMPSLEMLPDGLSKAAFQERYGSPSDPRFKELVEVIRERIRKLP
jgi:hypothetical protein